MHAEVGEDRRRSAVLATVRGPAQVDVRLDGVPAGVLQGVGPDLREQADPPALVPAQVDDDAALVRGLLERRVQLRTAVAAQRAEGVPGQALGVHAHQGGVRQRVHRDERDVLGAGLEVAVAVHPERAVLRRQRGDAGAVHPRRCGGLDGRAGGPLAGVAGLRVGVVHPAPGDEVLDGQQHQALGRRERRGVGQPGHRRRRRSTSSAIPPTGSRPREPAQVDGGLGVPGPVQHAARHGPQRQHVTGTDEVAGAGRRVAPGRAGCARGRRPRCRW